MRKIVRVNMTQKKVDTEDTIEKYRLLGGRALTCAILNDEVSPSCDPFRHHNKLVIAPGLLAGTPLSSASRLSIGGKSPLTGGIKEANAGGTAAFNLAKLNIKAIIIEGESKTVSPQYLYINNEIAELRPAEFVYKGMFESARLLYDRYGKRVSIILIGPAGERGFPISGISSTDREGRPTRFAARGGLGAVMGLKGLKAIVIDPEGASGVSYKDKKSFYGVVKELTKALIENPITSEYYPKYGTAPMVTRTNALKALPTRNFSQGSFEFEPYLNGKYLYHIITTRGGDGNPTHACMPGCIVKCSNIYPDSSGRELVSPIEYETIGLIGANCGIGNLDDIAKLNYICNDLGIDTIEVGATIGVLMGQNVISFGDVTAAERLLMEIKNNTLLGRVLGQGTLIAGRVFGAKRIPVVKGQAIAAYDPRSLKGYGVTYATSAMGADHTAGPTISAEEKLDGSDSKIVVEISRNAQINSAIIDSLGLCLFAFVALTQHAKELAEAVKYLYGGNFSSEKLIQMGKQVILDECRFNHKAGLGPAHNRLPEFMLEEPLPETNEVFDVPQAELDAIFKNL